MSDKLQRAPSHPKELARRRDARRQWLGTRANFLRGSIVAGWLAIAMAIGALMSAGSLVHASWLSIMMVATILSPIVYILLRAVNRSHEAARVALATSDDDGERAQLPERSTSARLPRPLADFLAETRMIRHGLSDAVEPGEGVRMLWEWRRSYDALVAREAEREHLAELGVGLGPIARMLAGIEQDSALTTEQRHEAAIHLGHVERLLEQDRGGGYR